MAMIYISLMFTDGPRGILSPMEMGGPIWAICRVGCITYTGGPT